MKHQLFMQHPLLYKYILLLCVICSDDPYYVIHCGDGSCVGMVLEVLIFCNPSCSDGSCSNGL